MHECPDCGFACDCDGEDTWFEEYPDCECDCYNSDEEDSTLLDDSWREMQNEQAEGTL